MSAAPLAIRHEFHKDLVPHFLGTLLAAAVLYGVDGFVIGLLAADSAVSGLGLLAIYITLVLKPKLIAKEILDLLCH
jgi:hypothetical protein